MIFVTSLREAKTSGNYYYIHEDARSIKLCPCFILSLIKDLNGKYSLAFS